MPLPVSGTTSDAPKTCSGPPSGNAETGTSLTLVPPSQSQTTPWIGMQERVQQVGTQLQMMEQATSLLDDIVGLLSQQAFLALVSGSFPSVTVEEEVTGASTVMSEIQEEGDDERELFEELAKAHEEQGKDLDTPDLD